ESASVTPPANLSGDPIFGSEYEPIRAELYGLEHLEAHARRLAETARTAPYPQRDRDLLRRFLHIRRDLERAYRRITEVARGPDGITTDAEWPLDTYHSGDENLREGRQDLPRGYYRELPKLADGPFAGFPRVYALALELITHTDSSLDEGNITRFVGAYQTVTPLTIGELWAVPIMLRLGLLENLCRLARHMLRAWDHRCEAEAWKDHLLSCKVQSLEEATRHLLHP